MDTGWDFALRGIVSIRREAGNVHSAWRDIGKVCRAGSKRSLSSSWWVDSEISRAFEKERKLMKERGQKTLALIPLDLDGYLLNGQWQSGKAQEVLSRFVADFRGWDGKHETFESAVEKVILALRTDDGARPPTPKPRL